MRTSLQSTLEAALSDTTGVLVPKGTDAATYLAGLAEGIRSHLCDPFPVSAVVTEPGFPDRPVGGTISGVCVAHSEGYWLVYEEGRDRFLCFWGTDASQLGAPGIYGSPLYCWSA